MHLKHVESLVDRSEPRNLILGFVQEKESLVTSQMLNQHLNKDINEEMLLYFENANKCSYVKNMLDFKKQS